MNEEAALLLIVGLGNPGVSYEKTRHNIGFRAVRAFAEKQGMKFRHSSRFLGDVAKGERDQTKLIALLPMTFMNCSGEAVRLCVDYFHIPLCQLLVVCDDVALPFGKLRMREKGSSGGHNGLKSVEEGLSSQDYPRLRMGVGNPQQEELADYVLGAFSSEENKEIPEMLNRAVDLMETWVVKTIKK